MTSTITHFVYVDFENVSEVELKLISEPNVQVTVLIGRGRRDFGLAFVQQVQRLNREQVQLIEVEIEGHNALDLLLASHLCQTAANSLEGHFFIVAKDKGYDSLVVHLKKQGIKASRHDAFADLPFLPAPIKKSLSKAPFSPKPMPAAKPFTPRKTPAPAKGKAAVDKYSKLLEQIKSGKHRPKDQAKLRHHIYTLYGQKSAEEELTKIVDRLITDRIIKIDDADKVTYL